MLGNFYFQMHFKNEMHLRYANSFCSITNRVYSIVSLNFDTFTLSVMVSDQLILLQLWRTLCQSEFFPTLGVSSSMKTYKELIVALSYKSTVHPNSPRICMIMLRKLNNMVYLQNFTKKDSLKRHIFVNWQAAFTQDNLWSQKHTYNALRLELCSK